MPALRSPYRPISPPPATGLRGRDLPAYVSNGLIGLRVRENPLRAGMALVSGFSGEHHERHVEGAAAAPYPLAGDLCVDGVWMGDQIEAVEPVRQAYDFATGELTSRVVFRGAAVAVTLEIVTFCSRTHPTLACQEVRLSADAACEVIWRGKIEPGEVRGELLRRRLDTPGEPEPACDGVVLWGSLGRLSSCGLALLTEGPDGAERTQEPWDDHGPLGTSYRLRLARGRPAVFRQTVSLLPSVLHAQPDVQALRLAAQAKALGFDEIRRRNRDAWAELWRSRVRLVGADEKWQALADATFFYLNTSVHAASPASTSIFGLATWTDYHYYFGHVMWDIDAFAVPPIGLLQPSAAEALLDFRFRHIDAARDNAKLQGLRGLRFPWEAAPSSGQEATPGAATTAAREDHVSLHVALAFLFHARATGDEGYLREKAWPVLAGVSDWIVSRVAPGAGRAFVWRDVGGPAERVEASDNDVLTNLLARTVLERAVELADELGEPASVRWAEVARAIAVPMRADGALAAHDGHRLDEEQGAAPTPLMALFPYWIEVGEEVAEKTLRLYLERWREVVGAPMLPALYPVWAAWLGDRRLALKLMDEGYGQYQSPRFAQALEYRVDLMGGVAAGPFCANMGGFLMTLLLGLPALRVGAGDPASWPAREVVLPEGWEAIECDRLWVHGRAMKLRARHGERAVLTQGVKAAS